VSVLHYLEGRQTAVIQGIILLDEGRNVYIITGLEVAYSSRKAQTLDITVNHCSLKGTLDCTICLVFVTL